MVSHSPELISGATVSTAGACLLALLALWGLVVGYKASIRFVGIDVLMRPLARFHHFDVAKICGRYDGGNLKRCL